jgi:hypothetical protein
MKPRVTLRKALADPNLLGHALEGDSWKSWRTLLIAGMGEPLDEDERATFRALTGREREPLQRVDQFAAVIGRRGGKSRAMATLAILTLSASLSVPILTAQRSVPHASAMLTEVKKTTTVKADRRSIMASRMRPRNA